MTRPEVVVLDVDGTLIDSNDAHARAWVETGAELGREIAFDEVRRLIGMGGDRVLPRLTGIEEDTPEGERWSARRGEIFRERHLDGLRPFPGARALLERLREDGYRLVVASSASEEDLGLLLEQAGVDDLVERRTSSDDADSSKPAPDIVEAALEEAGVAADRAVMLGDTPYDVEACLRAGVPIVAFRSGARRGRGMEERRGDGEALGAEATAPVPGRGWTEVSLALMVFVWGVNFAVVKHALEDFDPLGFNALRFLLASALVLLVLRARGPLTLPARADVPRILLLGLVGNLVYQLCFILGLDRTRAGTAAVVLALTPLVTALLSMLSGHERPGPRTWWGAALSIAGVALVSGAAARVAGGEALVGNLILLGACLAWAFYTVGARPLVRRYGSVPVTVWTLWTGAAGLLVVGTPALVRQPWGEVRPAAWGGLLFSAAFAIALSYLIWYRGVERLGNTRTAIFSNLTPIVALFAGAVLLGERPSLPALLGVALTLGGVMIVRGDPGAAGTERA